MNYIVLDMEWNQPSPGVKLEYENNSCLNNEIIQIGAVKMNADLVIIDTFETDIKPKKLRKVNRNVKKLTGIDDARLSDAPDIESAISAFRTWCGENFVFITWGYDDIGVLGNNLKYFGISTDWLPKFYNLQMIFCAQTENLNRQYSLTYAAEFFHITLDKPLHDALTDAYYTAKVCASLDLKSGIDNYRAMVFKDKTIPEHMKNIRYKRNYSGFKHYDKLIAACKIKCPVCPDCEKMLGDLKTSKNGEFHYLTLGKCELHGEFAELLKVNKLEDGSFNATEMFFGVDRYNKEFFLEKAKKMTLSDKRRKAHKKPRRALSQWDKKTPTTKPFSKEPTPQPIIKQPTKTTAGNAGNT